MGSGRLFDGPARPLRRSSAWRAGWTGSLGAPGRSAHLSRRAHVDRHGLAIWAGGHVAARQHAGQYVRCRVELGTQDVGESAFAGFDDGAGVVGDQPAQHGIGVVGVAQVPDAIELMQAGGGEAGGRSRCRAATRRLAEDRRPCRERVPGRVPEQQRPERAPSAGAKVRGGVPGRAVRPWCQRVRAARLDNCGGTFHGRGRPSEDVCQHQVPVVRHCSAE